MIRPLGVSIIAVLQALGSVILLVLGLALALFQSAGSLVHITGPLGFIIAIIGALGLILSAGLWNGDSWAYYITLILQILTVLSFLSVVFIQQAAFTMYIPSILVGLVILVYLLTDDATDYFF